MSIPVGVKVWGFVGRLHNSMLLPVVSLFIRAIPSTDGLTRSLRTVVLYSLCVLCPLAHVHAIALSLRLTVIAVHLVFSSLESRTTPRRGYSVLVFKRFPVSPCNTAFP